MSEFHHVTIVKKANVYFDGKVVSRTVLFADGAKKTLGIMQPGDYEFSPGDKEIMEINLIRERGLNPARDQRGCSPPLETPFICSRLKRRDLLRIMSGEFEVALPGVDGWQTVTSGASFKVAATAKFRMKVKTLTDYCCSFVK